MLYARESKNHDVLEAQLASVQSRLNVINIEKQMETETEVKEQQEGILLTIEPLQQTFSLFLSSVEVTDILFQIGTDSKVTITGITSPEPGTETINGISFSTLTSTISVNGTLSQLTRYVSALNNYFRTGVTHSVSIDIPDVDSEKRPSAEIQFVLYRYWRTK